ncbi:hypothetical protein V1281_004296 [Nitrobacteraceae bacterium AZCC 2161]
MSSEPPLLRDNVFDHGHSSAWARKISEDLAAEIFGNWIPQSPVPEVRRFFGEKGCRELRELAMREAEGKSGPEALRAMAHVMRRFSLRKPALTAATLQNIGEENAERLASPADSEAEASLAEILSPAQKRTF